MSLCISNLRSIGEKMNTDVCIWTFRFLFSTNSRTPYMFDIILRPRLISFLCGMPSTPVSNLGQHNGYVLPHLDGLRESSVLGNNVCHVMKLLTNFICLTGFCSMRITGPTGKVHKGRELGYTATCCRSSGLLMLMLWTIAEY